jgi:hypothetical protein
MVVAGLNVKDFQLFFKTVGVKMNQTSIIVTYFVTKGVTKPGFLNLKGKRLSVLRLC